MTMTLDEYQIKALRTALFDPKHDLQSRLTYCALGLAGEGGEVAEIVKKAFWHGHTLDQYRVIDELSDVLWYVAVLAHQLGWTLGDVAEQNVLKLERRYPRGFDPERSQHRTEGPRSVEEWDDGQGAV